jgi:nucleoside-diphosphate-sugar epimerase
MAVIILTGASGFLGKAIAQHLALQHSQVLTIGRRATNHIVCDLSVEIPLIAENRIDLVVHAAGKAHSIPKTREEVSQFFEVNFKGTQNLLNGLEFAVYPKKFVFISTVAVYGKANGQNIVETESLSAKDPYGLSKIQAEQLVSDWCQKNNVICTILRLPLLVGKNPLGNLGAMLKGIKKGYYFNIGGGTAKKSMALAEDVAQFIPKVASFGGTYNLTDGVHPTIKDLSQSIAKKKILNLPIFVAKAFGFLGDFLGEKSPINTLKIKKITSDLTFDDSKAREFGWESRSVLEYLLNNDL